jgi:hypothetical protein
MFTTTRQSVLDVRVRLSYRHLRRSGLSPQAARWCTIAVWCTTWQYTSPSVTK